MFKIINIYFHSDSYGFHFGLHSENPIFKINGKKPDRKMEKNK